MNFHPCMDSCHQHYKQDISLPTLLCFPLESQPPPPLTPGNHSSVLYPYSLVMFRMSYKWNHILWKLSDFFHSAKCLWDSSELCQQFISFYYWVVVKNPPARCEQRGFDPWVGKIPWRRKWQATPVFLPGKSHGRRNLASYSPWGHKESDMTKRLQS